MSKVLLLGESSAFWEHLLFLSTLPGKIGYLLCLILGKIIVYLGRIARL